MSDAPTLWQLEGPQFWGDYGDVLVAGLFDVPKRTNDTLNLMRTGPFVPPIAVIQAATVVVDAEFAHALRGAGFGLSFRPLNLTKVVRLDWEKWDRTASLPKVPPAGLEPENYLMRRKHSPETAAMLPPMLEVVLRKGAYSESHGPRLYNLELLIDKGSWNGDAMFFVNPRGEDTPVIVSDDMKRWLEAHAPLWVTFKNVRSLAERQSEPS